MQTEAGRNSCFPNIENSFGRFVQKEAINASASSDTDNYCKAKEHLHARRNKNNTTAIENKK